MNYIVLNGKRSTDINGLLIQKLAPISKPLIRTQVEEIDGRDGDIVTKLGYSAYNKEVTIGLHGNYNVDDAIQYFDSEGTVVFSNEPDKYYKYQILEPIDFAKLVRFRTATVTFHVQPFKYSAIDESVTLSNQMIELENTRLSSGGLTLTVSNGLINIDGTGRADFYVPIKPISLENGTYVLATKSDSQEGNVRLVVDVATDEESFGNRAICVNDELVVNVSNDERIYRYVWIRAYGSLKLDVSLESENGRGLSEIIITNSGNTYAKPNITVYGSGTIYLYVNNVFSFILLISNGDYITINADEMNAYKENILMNRYVTGDYDNLKLNVGKNVISWIGNVRRISVNKFSRWI